MADALPAFNPFARPIFPGDTPASNDPAPPTIWDKLAQTWPARLAQTMFSAATLPGDVYQGNAAVPQSANMGQETTANLGRVTDLAGSIMGGAYAAPAMKDASGMGIRAYHGSPYDFEKFSMQHIGDGSGSQQYGHGLYFAEDPKTAATYKLQSPETPGRMYEVNINADPEKMLDWFKTLGEQAPAVKDRLRYIMGDGAFESGAAQGIGGGDAYDSVASALLKQYNDPTLAARVFDEAGIPALKYPDKFPGWFSKGSDNYVVFNDKIIDILKKYGIAVPGTGAAAGALSRNNNGT